MTPGRIIGLALALLLCAQLAMISIGLQYAGSIRSSIQAQRAGAISEQLEHSLSAELWDLNNLLQLMLMPDTTRYFAAFMTLRDRAEADLARAQLQQRFRDLQMDNELIDSVYLIGGNINQQSHYMAGGDFLLQDIPFMRIDTLRHSGLEVSLLSDHDQFVRADMDKMRTQYSTASALLSAGEIADMEALLRHIDGHVFIASGNENVLAIIVLRDEAFQRLLPEGSAQGAAYTLVRTDGETLWSTTEQPELLRAAAESAATANARDGAYTNIIRELTPFRLRLVCAQRQGDGLFQPAELLNRMLAVSVLTLTVAFLFSFFYLQIVFRPFQRISRRMDAHSGAAQDSALFRPIPETQHNVFHTFTLRNKLIMLFCVALIILISADALLFSRLLDDETQRWTDDAAQEMGAFAAIAVSDQAQYYANTANQIATSQRFQNYVLENIKYSSAITSQPMVFPGIGGISYFVLLNPTGESFYSSIYSYNSQMFNIASSDLLDVDQPYWVLNYSNPVGKGSTALLRRVHWEGLDRVVWLLIVPREDAFVVAETDRIKANYSLSSATRYAFYTHQTALPAGGSPLRYTAALDHPGWTLSVEYVFSDVAALKLAYQERFLFSVLLVFLLSAAIVIRVSTVLTRPILRLKDAMAETWADGRTRLLEYDSADEIGGIIHSYNRMIVRLEEATQENLRITRENALNKIRENELLSMKARAEFSMLQAQINPHFLHNTLATINMLCLRHGDADTSGMVTALGDLLRYSISVGADTATLDQEMRHAANYIKIQQARFGNSFHAAFDMPQELKRCLVLRTILQPLIENAIKHGFEGWQSGGLIEITVQLQGTLLRLTVRDNGVGMDEATLQRLRTELGGQLDDWHSGGSSIGLKNVYHRLQLRYGERMSMEVHSVLMAGTTVELVFPAEFDAEYEDGNASASEE